MLNAASSFSPKLINFFGSLSLFKKKKLAEGKKKK